MSKNRTLEEDKWQLEIAMDIKENNEINIKKKKAILSNLKENLDDKIKELDKKINEI